MTPAPVSVDVDVAKVEAIANGEERRNGNSAAGVAQPDPIAAAEELAALLALPTVGLTIRGARIVGRGARASADIYLSDDTAITFESLRDIGTVNRLTLEVAACTGALPKLKAADALRAVSLLRALAEHQVSYSDDEIAREWGTTYLQAAQTIDVDLNDQAERWKAFSALEHVDPGVQHSARDIAVQSFILRHRSGLRLVRCGWFKTYVRAEDSVTGPEIAHRMTRVGWQRRGTTGRIKASRPGHHGQLAWSFYEVPSGWEDAG